jgi:hypothetical protein
MYSKRYSLHMLLNLAFTITLGTAEVVASALQQSTTQSGELPSICQLKMPTPCKMQSTIMTRLPSSAGITHPIVKHARASRIQPWSLQ